MKICYVGFTGTPVDGTIEVFSILKISIRLR